MFHFTESEKLWVFFLKPDLIPKFHLLKPNALLSIMVKIMVVTYIGQKMLEIIITEATFFLCGFSFMNIGLFQKKKTEGVEDMEFSAVLKK